MDDDEEQSRKSLPKKIDGQQQQQMEERKLLAAIGSTVTAMDEYESDVIRQATLSSAPTLTGIGFPDLARLSPSYDARRPHNTAAAQADIPNVHALLRKVRSELASLGKGQQPRETRQSLVLHMKEQMLLCFLKNVAKVPSADLPIQTREMVMEQVRSKLAQASSNNHVSSSTAGQGMLNGAQTADNASTALSAAKSLSQPGKHARVPMMKRKKLEIAKDEDDNETGRENSIDLEERNKILKQLRQERLDRREKRRQEWFGDDYQSGDDTTDSDQEVEMDDPPNVTTEIADSASEENGNDDDTSKPQAATEITCPLCQQGIDVADGADADAILSLHIDECQQRQGLRTRSQRGQAMASSGFQRPITENTSQPADSKKRKATTTKTATRNSIKTSTKKAKRQRPAPRVSNKPAALDDIEEWAYEDRVDDWVATGLLRMRHMKEQDANEVPPNAEEYPGGLFIPAWMNNRLFPYQRAGLRWMWELHLQEAGGIMGDEVS
jgi:hypothetical protein